MILNALLLGMGVVMVMALIGVVVWILDETWRVGRDKGVVAMAIVVGMALTAAVGAAIVAIIEQVAR